MVAGVLDAIERTEVKNQYQYTIVLKSGKSKALDGQENEAGSDTITQLNTWVNQPLPLTLNSNSVFEDGKIVMLEPSSIRLIHHEIDKATGAEIRHYSIMLLEVE